MPYKDPEKQKAYHQAYHQAHKDEINANKRVWRKAHLTYYQEYYKANTEEVKASKKAWLKANPEKRRENKQKHRALKRTTQVEPINDKVVSLRDGWICQICHKRVDRRFKYPHPMSASLDHIVPLNQGGAHIYRNVQLAHFQCNSSKQDRTLPQGEQIRLF